MTAHHDSAIAAPLVIGVTGHRRLRDADIASLQAQVRSVVGNRTINVQFKAATLP